MINRVLKTALYRLVKKAQAQGAREIDERRRTYSVRWSEAIERNEADGRFSTASQALNTNRLNRLDLLVLATIILIGLVHLPFPFGGDQALFTIGALKMSNGAILYRDFLDLKQPGIYGFYLFAGTLFGFNEVGVHTLELLYMAAFSVVLVMTLKGYYKNPLVASLTPLLTVGIYYGVSRSWHLTQIEPLVGFPLFLSLWFASKSSALEGRRALWFFLSGFMGGIVLLFKFVFLPILAGFWLTAFVDAVARKRERPAISVAGISVPIILGVLVSLVIVFGYFAWHDTLNLLYWAFFEYPARLMIEMPYSNLDNLIEGLKWFVHQFGPLMALGSIGAYVSLRTRRELVTVNLVLWLILGLAVILLQRWSWFEYHYLLLFVPLGILGAKGLDILWEQMKGLGPSITSLRGRVVAVLSLAMLFLPVLASLSKRGVVLAYDGFALNREQRLRYQSRFSSSYPAAIAEVAFLSEPGSLPGDIYICGNPIYYLLSGRNQAIALHGWALEAWLPTQSTQLREQLTKALPPYIFISQDFLYLIPRTSPETIRFIEENYRVLRASNAGTWYVVSSTPHVQSTTSNDGHHRDRNTGPML